MIKFQFIPLLIATTLTIIASFIVKGKKKYHIILFSLFGLWLIVFILTFYVKAFG